MGRRLHEGPEKGLLGFVDASLAKESARAPERALELFAENPFWTVPRLAERLGVAFTTAQRALDRLEAVGVVAVEGEARRNRVYCARELLAVLEEPASLRPGS